MSKFGVFLLILFLAILALFAIYNQNITIVKIPFGKAYETPVIALILMSVAAGSFAMLLVFIFRDTKKFIDTYQYQKKHRRDAKIQELYSKALNYNLAHHNRTEAKSLLKEILNETPEHLNALLQLGNISIVEEDFNLAKEYFQRAKEISPNNLDVLFSMVQLMEKTGRLTDAIRYLDEILDIDGENLEALYKKREFLEKLERWDEIVPVQKLIFKNENDPKLKTRERLNLVGYKYEQGRNYLENNELEKAQKAFRTVLRLDKNFIPATLGLAETLHSKGNSVDAVNLLEKTFEQTSSMTILLRLEDLLISIGEPLKLIRIYKNNISKSPGEITYKFLLARLYYRLEMIDDAFDVITSVDMSGLSNPAIYQLKGNIYLKRNQIEKAVHEFKNALESDECAPGILYICHDCGNSSSNWDGRCSNCKKWNTYYLNLFTRELPEIGRKV